MMARRGDLDADEGAVEFQAAMKVPPTALTHRHPVHLQLQRPQRLSQASGRTTAAAGYARKLGTCRGIALCARVDTLTASWRP